MHTEQNPNKGDHCKPRPQGGENARTVQTGCTGISEPIE